MLGAAALLAAAHTATWLSATTRIEAGISAYVARADGAGWRLQSGMPERAGWPFAATIRLPNVKAALDGTSLRWTAERLDVTLSIFDPFALHVTPAGAQTLARPEPLAVTLDLAWLRIPFDLNRPVTFDFENLLLAGTVHIPSLRGQAALDGLSTRFTLQAHAAPIPPARPPFDGMLTLAIDADVFGPSRSATTPAVATRAPHDRSSHLDIRNAQLDWGPVQLSASGAFALDGALRPSGHATLLVRGAAEALAGLARAGILAPGPEVAARAVIGLLGPATTEGVVSLPVTLADGLLTIARFPLLRVPSIGP